MSNQDVLNAIGLCKRANKLKSGEGMVVDSIKSKKAKIVIIANDCEKNTLSKVKNKCEFYNVELIQLDVDRYELGNAIGKSFRVCIAIEDNGFKKMILNKIRSD